MVLNINHIKEGGRMKQEIERKYVLRRMPDCLNGSSYDNIEQAYLLVAKDQEIRIRMYYKSESGKSFYLTRKSSGGLVRNEEEEEISPSTYDILLNLVVGRRITKRRHCLIGEDGLIWEIDYYYGDLLGLVTAEVELPNAEVKPKIPAEITAVLVDEVTEDQGYKNKNLAIGDLPK